MGSDGVPEGRCGLVLEPGDLPEGVAEGYEAESAEWHEDSEAACCWREVWDGAETDRCIWHAVVEDKPAEELIASRRVDGPERLDRAYVPDVYLGYVIDFDGCRLWAASFDGTGLERVSFESVDGRFARFPDADLRRAELHDADLRGAEFHETVLHGAELHDADLSRAELLDADLVGAELHDADLGWAELDRADLRYAALNHADLRYAELDDAILREAELHDADLRNAELDDAVLLRAKLHGADLKGAELQYADFYRADLDDADLSLADLHDASLDQAGLRNAYLEDVELHNADLWDADLHDADLRNADLHDANLQQADLLDVDLGDSDLSDADLTDATLTRASLEDATLTGADLTGTDLTDAALHDAHFLDVRINEETTFGDVVQEEAVADRLTHTEYQSRITKLRSKLRYWLAWWRTDPDELEYAREKLDDAHTVYRTIQRLYRENSMPERIDDYYVRAKETRRKQAVIDGNLRRWLNLAGQRWIMGYGEKPWNVVATSLLVVALSALLYPMFGLRVTKENPVPAQTISYLQAPHLPLYELGKSAYFSVITFTTLGYGDIQPVGVSETIATLESMVGAFLLALLVYVLGRRATR